MSFVYCLLSYYLSHCLSYRCLNTLSFVYCLIVCLIVCLLSCLPPCPLSIVLLFVPSFVFYHAYHLVTVSLFVSLFVLYHVLCLPPCPLSIVLLFVLPVLVPSLPSSGFFSPALTQRRGKELAERKGRKHEFLIFVEKLKCFGNQFSLGTYLFIARVRDGDRVRVTENVGVRRKARARVREKAGKRARAIERRARRWTRVNEGGRRPGRDGRKWEAPREGWPEMGGAL